MQATSPLSQSYLMENRNSCHDAGVKPNTDSSLKEYNRTEASARFAHLDEQTCRGRSCPHLHSGPQGQRRAQVRFRQLTVKEVEAA